ncbi:hypothetical protein [Paenibacillus maysiensis]|uniref:hypothetical protein n=1 Tax=Paenibacillus maysiensis TaxID=1155954 RepID=UPI000470226D|nr:hypothetical protein [Paenibacillus maysiensis]
MELENAELRLELNRERQRLLQTQLLLLQHEEASLAEEVLRLTPQDYSGHPYMPTADGETKGE